MRALRQRGSNRREWSFTYLITVVEMVGEQAILVAYRYSVLHKLIQSVYSQLHLKRKSLVHVKRVPRCMLQTHSTTII